MRKSIRDYAALLGIEPTTISNWRAKLGATRPHSKIQAILDTTYQQRASPQERERFAQIVAEGEELWRQRHGGGARPDDGRGRRGARSATNPDRAPTGSEDLDQALSALNPDHRTRFAKDLSTWPSGGVLGELISASASSSAPATLRTPPGRFFTGSTTSMFVVPGAADRGRVLATPGTALTARTLAHPDRALVVAALKSADGPRFYGLDKRAARARLTASATDAPLLIPGPYRLDEFTLSIVWAVTNLDDALLDDDAELTTASHRLPHSAAIPRSALSPEHAPELSAVSRMWLGSDFCARHILRHADTLTEAPRFWTREQRGEEASTWLFFAHKFDYLTRLSQSGTGPDAAPTRSFCIPPEAVSSSWVPERILMLLAVALIESFSIRVSVCVEPEYSAIEGFVLDDTGRAIVADWISTDRVWQVDVTDNRPTVREFSDASGWAKHHTILPAATPHQRLRALADYLELDWPWLLDRAAGLADYGTTGFLKPRNRLLSLAGLDRACRFLAEARGHDR